MTPRAKQTLILAHIEADLGGKEVVDTEHILLGLLADDVSPVKILLANMNTDRDELERDTRLRMY
jgi:ATP-dependent Clp protease ATP-binding subunit ClpA